MSALARYDGLDALALTILDEIEAVARAEGVTVDPAAALRLMRAQFDPSASGDHLASTLQDLMLESQPGWVTSAASICHHLQTDRAPRVWPELPGNVASSR